MGKEQTWCGVSQRNSVDPWLIVISFLVSTRIETEHFLELTSASVNKLWVRLATCQHRHFTIVRYSLLVTTVISNSH